MRPSTDILLLSDGGPVSKATADALLARGFPHRVLPPETSRDDVVEKALGCRAIIAMGSGARLPILRAAAEMPGVRGVVLVVADEQDLGPLKRSGIPYSVLRPAPLLEDLVAALGPAMELGTLVMSRESEPELSWVAARDVGRCAVAAIDSEDACGRVIEVASPEPLPLGELASRVAVAAGRTLRVRRLPRWALWPMRVLGKRPFVLTHELVRKVDGAEAAPLVDRRWSRIEEVVTAVREQNSTAVS